MDNSLLLCIFLFCLLLLVNVEEFGAELDECKETRCKHHGPTIRFPFWLKDHHPEHCRYPGFELSCTEDKDTMLELPRSVKLFIEILNFNCISLSVRRFVRPSNYTFFNCSSDKYPYDVISYPLLKQPWLPDRSVLSLLLLFIMRRYLARRLLFALYRVYRYDKIEKENQARIEKFLEDYIALKPTRYSYADVKRITNQFNEKLGQGAYGTVFKGKLSNEIHVAVKILISSKGNGEEFINEVGTMGRIHHVNVVRLVGFCADGFRRALVYEFLPNDSLEKFISSVDSNRFLGWDKLQDIALGIAKGIEYLHQGCVLRIKSAVSMTQARGTMGYIAPEVFSRNFGNVSYKSDVYSFGIMLLEMVGGRKNVDVTVNTSEIYFPEWIYNLLEKKEDLRVFVEDNGHAKIAKKLAIVGLWCIQWHPVDRPSMKVVVQMLEGEGDNLTMPPNPFASIGPTRINVSMPARRLNQELEVIPELE
uniref:Protein kinase domain-containing protein n=1 Tax=Fagus sylvatica TaxID=28930 RepID=A0A2N9HRX0_FAGSY